ncbi:MAG: hypothetical protein M3Y57_09315 [Acidobacteriota bacterium]|nr:hypothetical protein [Acidobacteriota bacterium]
MATAAQSWEIPITGGKRWAVRFLPSLTDFAFLLPAFILFAILPGAKTLLNDSDTGWHLRVGEWILQHKAVPTTDFFSFTKANQPWFAWEWGWDLLFGAIHSMWGLPGVVLANVLILCFVSALLFRLIRRFCDNDILALLFTGISIFGSTIHWLARPHLLSWVFFLAFAHLLLSAEQGKTKALYWLPLLMLLWTNLHGSFFLGIVMIMISGIAPWISAVLQPGIAWKGAYWESRPYLLCALLCGMVTFANPYTWRLHEHLFLYLRDSSQLDAIQEFQSISFHYGLAAFFEIMLLTGAASALWCIQRQKWTGALTLLLWAHLALFSRRNVPMYLLLASPWIAKMVAQMSADGLRSLRLRPWLQRAAGGLAEIALEFRPLERINRLHVTSLFGILFIFLSMASARPGFEAQFNTKRFPASAIPVIQAQNARRIFTNDQWSGYLIYQLYPDVKVFVDGRSDLYGGDFVNSCLHTLNGRWDWEINLNRFSVDMVIVAPGTPLSTVLKMSPRWRTLLDDGSVMVFAPKSLMRRQDTPLTGTNNFQPLNSTEEASLKSKRGLASF